MKMATVSGNAPSTAPLDEWPFRDHRTMAEVMAAARNLEPPPSSLAIRKAEFGAWVGKAKPGERVEYHRGHLILDRSRGPSPFSDKHRRELNAIANRALAMAEEGRLLLVQQRHGHGDYSYFAIKATRQAARPRRVA